MVSGRRGGCVPRRLVFDGLPTLELSVIVVEEFAFDQLRFGRLGIQAKPAMRMQLQQETINQDFMLLDGPPYRAAKQASART